MPQRNYKLQIMLLSDALIGTAEGYGTIIDKDSVFDAVGLPLIPGKRVKGVLREQAELLKRIRMTTPNIDKLFGRSGMTNKNTETLAVGNFKLCDYHANQRYMSYLISKGAITRAEIINCFTTLRMMTRIEDGIAADTSLRTVRVLNKGLVFYGEIALNSDYYDVFKDIFALTRRIGSMRNRGLGHIQCTLLHEATTRIEPANILTR